MNSAYSIRYKRLFDIIVSVVFILFFSPVMLLAWLAVKLTSRGPAFFVSKRIGKDSKPFRLLKFRTMYSAPLDTMIAQRAFELAAEGVLLKMEDDPRVSPVGRLLRRTSIDELPQLFNVLRGNMSIVGPRPLIEFMIEAGNPESRKRLVVLPGITGYWQIYAREKNNSVHDMLPYDLQYINDLSLGTDLKILLFTTKAVFSGRGAF